MCVVFVLCLIILNIDLATFREEAMNSAQQYALLCSDSIFCFVVDSPTVVLTSTLYNCIIQHTVR